MGRARQEVREEDRHVHAAVAQRRQIDPRRLDAREEIAPKAPRCGVLLQRPVRGDHDPRRERVLRGLPDRAHGPLLERPEQLRLRGRRELPDLVEEDRARAGGAQQPIARLRRAAEGPARVAEELTVEERVRDRGAVDGHERLSRARAARMERARDQLLARARLASNQHRRRLGRERADRPLRAPRFGARAHDPEVVDGGLRREEPDPEEQAVPYGDERPRGDGACGRFETLAEERQERHFAARVRRAGDLELLARGEVAERELVAAEARIQQRALVTGGRAKDGLVTPERLPGGASLRTGAQEVHFAHPAKIGVEEDDERGRLQKSRVALPPRRQRVDRVLHRGPFLASVPQRCHG